MQPSLPFFGLSEVPPVDSERHRRAMPLNRFSFEHQQQIADDVARPKPPPRWRNIGGEFRPIAQIENRAWWEWHWQRGIDPDKKREPIPSWMRAVVITRDGYVCGICTEDVDPGDVHLDHIKPVALGGPTEVANLRVTHSLCNMRKGARY